MSLDSVEAAVESTFPAAEAKEEGSNAPSSSDGEGDLRSEMIAALKEMEGAEEDNQEPAPEAKASDTAEAKPDKGDDEARADPESDEDEEAEAKESGDEPDKPKKKPSGWQKAKKKIAELETKAKEYEARVESLKDRDSKWEHVSGLLQQRLEESEQRLAEYEARLRELGAGPDPRESQVADLERRLREQQAEIERREREFTERQQRAQQQEQQRRIAAIKAEVARVAEANGLDPDDLAAGAAARAKAASYRGQPPPSLDKVAQELVALQRLEAGQRTQRQAEVSGSAPKPVRGSAPSPTAPNFEPTTQGALAFLKSQGLA